jgi:hypothetical protein
LSRQKIRVEVYRGREVAAVGFMAEVDGGAGGVAAVRGGVDNDGEVEGGADGDGGSMVGQ